MNMEEKRYQLQLKLDSEKDNKARNILGQFSTPYLLAKDMVKYVLSFNHDSDIMFLEPSIGTGVFFSALVDVAKPTKAIGFEIDAHYYKPTKRLWSEHNLTLVQGDFFDFEPTPDYNLIIANPPYSRHHHIENNIKRRLQSIIKREYGLEISGLSGLYCYFLILSTRWLREGGLSCWLIPSEFLDVNYGKAVKEFLCTKVELISIHRFNPGDLQFSDALVSSSIIVFRNRKPSGQKIRLTTGSNISAPEMITEIPITELNPQNKWNSFFDSQYEVEALIGKSLGEFFKVSRGISTGNNSFFIMSKDIALQRNLPQEFLIPILPAPRNLNSERINKSYSETEEFVLLSCPLSIDIIKSKYPSLYDYIIDGEQRLLNKRYNCSRRSPWYLCEKREPAPFYMTYMGRGENSSRMFRFILNESKSIVTNSYLMLYPRDKYKYCFSNIETIEQVWSILNNIPKERLAKCGRTYGGGLFKIEPKELESLVVPELATVLLPQQGSLFDFGD